MKLLQEFDPVVPYLQDLQVAFGDIAMFFYDRYGGDKIALVWRPGTTNSQPFKVNLMYNAMPNESDGISANKDAMLAEMQRLGQDLVLGFTALE